jgi:hypothetical protein
MGRGKDLNAEQLGMVRLGYQLHLTYQAIADQVNCSKTAVGNTIRRFEETGSFAPSRHTGRPPLITTPQRKRLKQFVTSNGDTRRLNIKKLQLSGRRGPRNLFRKGPFAVPFIRRTSKLELHKRSQQFRIKTMPNASSSLWNIENGKRNGDKYYGQMRQWSVSSSSQVSVFGGSHTKNSTRIASRLLSKTLHDACFGVHFVIMGLVP